MTLDWNRTRTDARVTPHAPGLSGPRPPPLPRPEPLSLRWPWELDGAVAHEPRSRRQHSRHLRWGLLAHQAQRLVLSARLHALKEEAQEPADAAPYGGSRVAHVARVHQRVPRRHDDCRDVLLALHRPKGASEWELALHRVCARPQRGEGGAAASVLVGAIEGDVARHERPVLMEAQLDLAEIGFVPERGGRMVHT